MKIRVTMKDPDCLYDAIREAVEAEVKALNLPAIDAASVEENRIERAQDTCRRWFEYGEYLTVEIDTEANTAVVVPRQS